MLEPCHVTLLWVLGLGKGHLIREIDALGGLIGRASDLSGIQFRVLNRTRGEAVQGPRAQIDRAKYKKHVKPIKKEKISLLFDEVVDINLETKNLNKKVAGLKLKNLGPVICKAIVLTTGTFMRGTIYQGKKKVASRKNWREPLLSLQISLKKIILSYYVLKLAPRQGLFHHQLISNNVKNKKET